MINDLKRKQETDACVFVDFSQNKMQAQESIFELASPMLQSFFGCRSYQNAKDEDEDEDYEEDDDFDDEDDDFDDEDDDFDDEDDDFDDEDDDFDDEDDDFDDEDEEE